MEETRYAIIIGINDYRVKPLRFSSLDAAVIQSKLISHCGFEKKFIKTLISTNEEPISDVYQASDT